MALDASDAKSSELAAAIDRIAAVLGDDPELNVEALAWNLAAQAVSGRVQMAFVKQLAQSWHEALMADTPGEPD